MRSHGKITWQCKSTLTQPSEKKDAVQHETRETSTVRETDERKINVLSCFYTCFLISSYLFSFVNLASTLHAGVCLFVCFFWARPRGTLIATAIIKETRKLRINLSLGSLFWLAPTLCHSNVHIFCTAKYACRPRGLPSTRNQWIQSLKSQLFEIGIQQGPI